MVKAPVGGMNLILLVVASSQVIQVTISDPRATNLRAFTLAGFCLLHPP